MVHEFRVERRASEGPSRARDREPIEDKGTKDFDMGENEQQPFLRSINNRMKSFVRFVNKTPYNVRLYWIDYEGQPISYGVLSRSDKKDIDTFVTHPWIAIDEITHDRYALNHKEVYFPEPWFYRYRGLRRDEIPLRIERENVNITLPMLTLRELSMRTIQRCLSYDEQAFDLDIPRSLQNELARMLPKFLDYEDDPNEDPYNIGRRDK